MAEMILVPSLYRKYGSKIRPGSEHIAPGITSRLEVFTDDTYAEMKACVYTKSTLLQLMQARNILAGFSFSLTDIPSLPVNVVTASLIKLRPHISSHVRDRNVGCQL